MKATTKTCPVLPLAVEFDALEAAYNRMDEKHPNERQMLMVLWDRMDAIREQASYLTPASVEGATFQIMMACGHLDTLTDQEGRDQEAMEALMNRLMFRAVDYLASISARKFPNTRSYSMGEHIDPLWVLRALMAPKAA